MPHYRVPWLQGKFKGQTVKDETDEWKKCLHEQDWQEWKNFFPRTPSQKNLHICYVFVQILASIVCFSTYLIAFILHGITISIISQRAAEIFSNTIELYHRTKSAFMLVSIMSSLIIGKLKKTIIIFCQGAKSLTFLIFFFRIDLSGIVSKISMGKKMPIGS